MSDLIKIKKEKINDVIKIENLTKKYSSKLTALDNICLDVSSNDFTAVIGPSGAGKSTLLRCINRLVSPTSGHIYLNGKDITNIGGARLLNVRRRIGMIFQQFNLVKRVSVIENVLVGRLRFSSSPVKYFSSLGGKFMREDREAAFECLRQVGIEKHAFQRADTLSGGQQQRVAIARVLAQNPDIILADEPVASLDPRSSDMVLEILQKIHEEKKIPVMINLHQLEIAKNFTKKIFALNQGEVVFKGKSSTLSINDIKEIYGYIPGELQYKKVSNF
ncbi:MAG: phosphonate ABC transporter ATP-binding protein [Desulforegulaceae bacterium]|nr:phosphonate ABC transporter ATP-binding protein [Desulforegulaceae bacterium]